MANHVTRFAPFSDIARFDPVGAVDEWLREFTVRPFAREPSVPDRMKVDVSEADRAYTIIAEVPGARKEDISVDVEGNTVSIRAELKRDSKERQGTLLCCERFVGEQRRSLTLAQAIDDANVVATCADGVLLLTLPKKTSRPATRITVN